MIMQIGLVIHFYFANMYIGFIVVLSFWKMHTLKFDYGNYLKLLAVLKVMKKESMPWPANAKCLQMYFACSSDVCSFAQYGMNFKFSGLYAC